LCEPPQLVRVSPRSGAELTSAPTDRRLNCGITRNGGRVDRKVFLKSVCGLGVCGCGLNLLGASHPAEAAETPAEDQRLVSAR
jgi:hypothetical protein